jgi:hypothetical protein
LLTRASEKYNIPTYNNELFKINDKVIKITTKNCAAYLNGK